MDGFFQDFVPGVVHSCVMDSFVDPSTSVHPINIISMYPVVVFSLMFSHSYFLHNRHVPMIDFPRFSISFESDGNILGWFYVSSRFVVDVIMLIRR